MSETNRKIDVRLRRERWKRIKFFLALAPIAAVFLWFVAPNAGPTEEVEGVVLRMIGRPGEEGERLYLMVKLDDGTEARSRIQTAGQYRKDRRVRLLRQKPVSFGRSVYLFYGYVKDDA